MQQLPDRVLASVLWRLSCNNRPADLRRVLRCMVRDQKSFGSSGEVQQDEQGRSFLTVWLAARPRSSVQGFHSKSAASPRQLTQTLHAQFMSLIFSASSFNLWGQLMGPLQASAVQVDMHWQQGSGVRPQTLPPYRQHLGPSLLQHGESGMVPLLTCWLPICCKRLPNQAREGLYSTP